MKVRIIELYKGVDERRYLIDKTLDNGDKARQGKGNEDYLREK